MKIHIPTPLFIMLISLLLTPELRSQTCIEIQCPTNMITECESPGGTPVGYVITATNNCSTNLLVSCMPPPGSVFPMGVTTVLCTAWDDAGNSNECRFTVTVRDTGSHTAVTVVVSLSVASAGPVLNISQHVFTFSAQQDSKKPDR